jgi:hypothetical protein
MHKSTKKLATQLQTKRAQTAKLTNALHERDARLTTLSRNHHCALASAETCLGQREAEAAWAQSAEMHTKRHEHERHDAEAALRALIHALRQSSALKEVQLVHPTKLRARDGEDLDGMNIALDSKQQELELVCSFFVLLFGMCLLGLAGTVEETSRRARDRRDRNHHGRSPQTTNIDGAV